MAERRFSIGLQPLLSGPLPWLAWLALIFGLSAQGQSTLTPYTSFWAFPHADKLMHFSEYAVLGALTLRMLDILRLNGRSRTDLPLTKSVLAAAWGICAVSACLDEFSQRFSPGRSSDAADVLADCLGAAAGILAWRALLLWRHPQGKEPPHDDEQNGGDLRR